MTPDEGRAIYAQAVSEITARFVGMLGLDRSSVDHAVASWCARRGMNEADIAAVVLHGSAKAAERGAEYARRTARAVMMRA
jgi:hypothetical protein